MIRKRFSIQIDPERAKVWRMAWDLLLTDKYTLKQICQELHNHGFTRRGGKPWVWEDPLTGTQKYAVSKLVDTFHNPFYAGWVHSKEFGIQAGVVRGKWAPLVTQEEFEKGLRILHKHDANKVRTKRHPWLLAGLLYMHIDEDDEGSLPLPVPA